MKILETKQCVFKVKQLIKYSSGLYAVKIITLDKNLKATKKSRVFTYKFFGDAFSRWNDGNYSAREKFSKTVQVSVV